VWNAKEDLLDLLATARTQPSHEHVHRLLHRFYTRCAASDDLPELPRLATTIETWWPQINAFLTTGITNAGSLRGHQPRHLNRRPQCLRLPKPREPTATHLHRHHTTPPRTPQPA
jgi:hypothetical protein